MPNISDGQHPRCYSTEHPQVHDDLSALSRYAIPERVRHCAQSSLPAASHYQSRWALACEIGATLEGDN
jgi:hypothetical protein